MIFSLDLLAEAVLFGVLLGCFYAAVSIGLSVSFGLLDVPHVAHPAVMVLGSYCTYLLARAWASTRSSPASLLMPVFFVLGIAVYRFYYETFEKRGTDAGVRGTRVLLRPRLHHRGRADPRLRRRPALGEARLHRQEPGARRHTASRTACWSPSASRWS